MRYKKVMDGLSHLVISAAKQFWSVLPEGSRLPEDVWQKRYSFCSGSLGVTPSLSRSPASIRAWLS
jgi:hypothetical protein